MGKPGTGTPIDEDIFIIQELILEVQYNGS